MVSFLLQQVAHQILMHFLLEFQQYFELVHLDRN